MILKTLKLHNFRGYKDALISFDDSLSVIIGKNDVGKSTILEALAIFFESNQIKMDENDLCVKHDEGDENISISCEFLVDNELVIDSTVRTDLEKEYLLNKNGLLEIVYKCENGKKAGKRYLNAYYPIDIDKPLIQLKIDRLRQLLEQKKNDVIGYERINKSVSSEIRLGYYSALGKEPARQEILIETSKDEAKNIYTALSKELPMFFLFKADRENKDGDSEVQNPLKAATKDILKNIEPDLQNIIKKVEEQVKTIGDETIEKMRELDSELAQGLKTSVNTKPWDSIFSFQLIDDQDIPLNKRGSGVRRLILLSYLRAEAERKTKIDDNNSIIYAIEEPETAQHPDYQRLLMESLIALAENPVHQILITTHTPEIAKMASLDQIIFIKRVEGTPQIITDQSDKLKDVIKTLGVNASLDSKVVICVEGENDVNFLTAIGRLNQFKDIVDLSDERISIIPMQGGSLKNWILRDYLKNSNVKEIHIYDSDVNEYIKKIDTMNAQNDGRRKGFITHHYEMENYIPMQLVEQEFNLDLSEYNEMCGDCLDIPKLLVGKVKRKLGKDDKEKEKIIKNILNGKIMKKCTFEMIRNMGNADEIISWFSSIRDYLL